MQGVKPQSSKYWKYSIIFARSQTSKLKILKIQHNFCKESNLKSKYWKYSIIFARSQTSKLKILKIQHNFCKESNLKSKYSNYFAKNQTSNQNIPNILQGVKPQKSKYWKYSIIWPPIVASYILIFTLYGSRDELAIKKCRKICKNFQIIMVLKEQYLNI